MPNGTIEHESDSLWKRRQRRIIALLLLLIPFGIPAGLFAPNFIAVVTTPSAADSVGDRALETPRVALDHEPLHYRSEVDFLRSWTPPKSHTAKLARLLRPAPPPPAPSLAFTGVAEYPAPASGESLDESGQDDDYRPAIETLFSGDEEFDLRKRIEFLTIEFSTGGSTTQPPAIPEPDTGAMLGAGLIALAVRRRSVRRGRSRTGFHRNAAEAHATITSGRRESVEAALRPRSRPQVDPLGASPAA